MAFGRKSVDVVKAWTLAEGNRGEAAITFGDFPSVEGSLWNRPCSHAAASRNVCLSHAIPCTSLAPAFSDSSDW